MLQNSIFKPTLIITTFKEQFIHVNIKWAFIVQVIIVALPFISCLITYDPPRTRTVEMTFPPTHSNDERKVGIVKIILFFHSRRISLYGHASHWL